MNKHITKPPRSIRAFGITKAYRDLPFSLEKVFAGEDLFDFFRTEIFHLADNYFNEQDALALAGEGEGDANDDL